MKLKKLRIHRELKDYSLFLLLGMFVAAITTGITTYLFSHEPLVWRISLGVTVVLCLGYVWIEWKNLLRVISKRTSLYGLNSIFMAIIFLAIVVFVNRIAINYDMKIDLTKNKLHSLSEQSIKIIKGLDTEIKLRAFITAEQEGVFNNIFEKYAYYNKEKVKKEFIDVHRQPLVAQKHNIKRPGTIIIESGTRSEKVENLSGPGDPKLEHKITNAILQALKGGKKKIYFITGHGERLISDTKRTGYSQIKEVLTSGRYEVEELLLADKKEIPKDTELLVIAAPKSNFMEHERKMLSDFLLKRGGNALIMVEPNSTKTLQPLLKKFGVKWGHMKLVAETNVLNRLTGANPLTPIVMQYDRNHDITRPINQPTMFAIASPVEKAEKAPEGIVVTSIFSTTNKSFEVQYKEGQIQIRQNKDRRGPHSLAVAVTGTAGKKEEIKKKEKEDKPEENKFRLVVVGDSDFASNGLRNNMMNADLFQNMLSWLSEEEELIAIRPKELGLSKFEITEQKFKVINIASVAIAPLIMLLSALAVWFIRKRK